MKSYRIFAILVAISGYLLADETESIENLNSANNQKVRKVYQALPQSDLDQNGVLTVVELRAYADQILRENATSRNHLLLWKVHRGEKAADLNHDGVLTKGELISHYSQATSWHTMES